MRKTRKPSPHEGLTKRLKRGDVCIVISDGKRYIVDNAYDYRLAGMSYDLSLEADRRHGIIDIHETRLDLPSTLTVDEELFNDIG